MGRTGARVFNDDDNDNLNDNDNDNDNVNDNDSDDDGDNDSDDDGDNDSDDDSGLVLASSQLSLLSATPETASPAF